MTLVHVSLAGAVTTAQVLDRLGQTLELGGPEGNFPTGAVDGKGWGLNWDALSDSLTYLESGGIWGTSREFAFPLTLNITESHEFKISNPEALATLREILEDTKDFYAKHGKEFQFELS